MNKTSRLIDGVCNSALFKVATIVATIATILGVSFVSLASHRKKVTASEIQKTAVATRPGSPGFVAPNVRAEQPSAPVYSNPMNPNSSKLKAPGGPPTVKRLRVSEYEAQNAAPQPSTEQFSYGAQSPNVSNTGGSVVINYSPPAVSPDRLLEGHK